MDKPDDLDSILTIEQRKAIIEQQISGWATNYYSQMVSIEAVLNDNPDADVTAMRTSTNALKKAIAFGKRKIDGLDAEVAAEKEASEAAARMFAEGIEKEALSKKR